MRRVDREITDVRQLEAINNPQTTYHYPAEKLRAVSVIRVAIESMTGKRFE